MNDDIIIQWVRDRLSQIPIKGDNYLLEWNKITKYLEQNENNRKVELRDKHGKPKSYNITEYNLNIVLRKKHGKSESFSITDKYIVKKMIDALKQTIQDPFTGESLDLPETEKGGQEGLDQKTAVCIMITRDLYFYYKQQNKSVYGVRKYIASIFEGAGYEVKDATVKTWLNMKHKYISGNTISPDFPIKQGKMNM